MNFLAIESQLNDLPTTFKRPGAWYMQLIDSLSSCLCGFTFGSDGTFAQASAFANAVDGWLDVWGLLFNVPREQNESNIIYQVRIQRTVLAWVATLPAMQIWIDFYAPGGSVTENLPDPGYEITLPANMTAAQVRAFLVSLNRIRPLGVPFTVVQIGSGLFAGTEAYLGTGMVQGSYLAASSTPVPLPFGASTPNAVPLLPTLYFNDPTLNPSLVAT